jgi:hypothetical protein
MENAPCTAVAAEVAAHLGLGDSAPPPQYDVIALLNVLDRCSVSERARRHSFQSAPRSSCQLSVLVRLERGGVLVSWAGGRASQLSEGCGGAVGGVQEPVTMLASIRAMMGPHSLLLLALVLPFSAFVEKPGGRTAPKVRQNG